MEPKQLNVLMVEDNPGDVRLVKEFFKDNNVKYSLKNAATLQEALALTEVDPFDAIILDLQLPDAAGIKTFQCVHCQVPGTPIIVFTNLDDKTLSMKVLDAGAQDYLIKSRSDGNVLLNSLSYSIERQSMVNKLWERSLVDELTGVYNRRGFLFFSKQHLQFARRFNHEISLIFTDLDNLKFINDHFGHGSGDWVLQKVGVVLKEVFRETDLIARVGGDEFVVMALNCGENNASVLINRINQKMADFNKNNLSHNQLTNLSLSSGSVQCQPDSSCSLEKLLDTADKLMYEDKKRKHQSNNTGEVIL